MKTNCVTRLIKTKSPPKIQITQFIRKFGKIDNLNKLLFMEDGVPTYWYKNASKCLNENLSGRCIGIGGPQDWNFTWPRRSPEMTTMDYFL